MRYNVNRETLIGAIGAALKLAHRDVDQRTHGAHLRVTAPGTLDIVGSDGHALVCYTAPIANVEEDAWVAITITNKCARALIAWLKTQRGTQVTIDTRAERCDEYALERVQGDYPAYGSVLALAPTPPSAEAGLFDARLFATVLDAFRVACGDVKVTITIGACTADELTPTAITHAREPMVALVMPCR